MATCLHIADYLLPDMVESGWSSSSSLEDNLSHLLGLAQQMQTNRPNCFKSPGLVAKSLVCKMETLKGFVPHPEATGEKPQLRAVYSLPKTTSRKWKGGLTPEGLQEQILPCDLPSRFRSKRTSTSHRLLTAAEVQFNLLLLIMANLFTPAPGEETASCFREEVLPQYV